MDPLDSSEAKQLQIPQLIRGSMGLDAANTEDNNNNNNSNGNNSNQVVVTIDMLTMALLLASVLYAFCLILAKRKLSLLSRLDPEMSTKKLLVLSVALVSAVRIMTILGVAMMNVANVRAHYSLHPPGSSNSSHSRGGSDRHQDFYDEAMTVLFDLPNVMVVSTYVLLTLVWAECFLESRLHTESATNLRRTWLIFFMVFNSCLYMAQITLYGSIFLAPVNTVVRTIIYVGITGINFTAVLLVLIFYIYLNVRFSGFPPRSQRSQLRLSRVSSVMTLWSLTRVIWGAATLVVYKYDIELLQDSNTPIWSFLVLLLLFVVCEILPIVVLLDYSYLSIVGLELVEIRSIDDGIGDGDSVTAMNSSGVLPEHRSMAGNRVDNRSIPTVPGGDLLLPRTPPRSSSGRRGVRWQDELSTASTDPLLEQSPAVSRDD